MNRIGRWLYIAALCQLLAGPLVLGGLAGIVRWWRPLSEGRLVAGPPREEAASVSSMAMPTATGREGNEAALAVEKPDRPAAPGKPAQKSAPDGKGKLWFIEESPADAALALAAVPERVGTAWRNGYHPPPGPAPPTPPPRGV